VMKSVGVDASFEDVSEIIIELDSDGDGKIRYAIFNPKFQNKNSK
jgi:Ca2+-binding EF-hand superfamily protein